MAASRLRPSTTRFLTLGIYSEAIMPGAERAGRGTHGGPPVPCSTLRSGVSPVLTIGQRAIHGGDVQDPDEAGIIHDRQVPEMAVSHDRGGVTHGRRAVDGGRH